MAPTWSWTLLTLGVLALVGVCPVGAVCDGFAWGRCVGKLQRGQEDMDGVFYTMDALDASCKSYEEASECMEDVLPDCMPELEERWLANVQAFDYLCGSARIEYERYVDCYNKSNDWLVSDLTWCHRTKEDIRDVMIRSSRHWLPRHVHHVTCKMLQNYEMCVSRSVVNRCSLDAATWQREVLHQLLLPQLKEEKC